MPVEIVLAAMIGCAGFLLPWMIGAYAPSQSGDSSIEPGMTQKEVLVILGEPSEAAPDEHCWNYNTFHDGKYRFCVQFDNAGRVTEVSPQ
jgi:outer membrane protein assembly factor BamE (lipoprotein component of BamABCDE complex)